MRIGGGAYKNQMMKQLNEVMYKDRSGKSFNIKGISIIYRTRW